MFGYDVRKTDGCAYVFYAILKVKNDNYQTVFVV